MLLLGAVGFTLIVTLSSIMWRFRFYTCRILRRLGLKLHCPLYCPMCIGFWVGVLFSISSPDNIYWVSGLGYNALIMGCSTSVVSLVVSIWLRDKGVYTLPSHDTKRWRTQLLIERSNVNQSRRSNS